MQKTIYKILIIVCSVVFICACVVIINYENQISKVDKTNETVQTIAHNTNKPDTKELIQVKKEQIQWKKDPLPVYEGEKINLEGLKELNPDTYAYIQIKDTPIDLPVMRNDDPNKYYRTDFNLGPSVGGTLYVDNSTDISSENIVIYGHRMNKGSMFGSLKKYLEEEYKNEHPSIILTTENEVGIYDVVAAVVLDDDSTIIDELTVNKNENIDHINSVIASEGTLYRGLEPNTRYITLITCDYTYDNGRLAVIGQETERYLRAR